jgi:hypothetical protein
LSVNPGVAAPAFWTKWRFNFTICRRTLGVVEFLGKWGEISVPPCGLQSLDTSQIQNDVSIGLSALLIISLQLDNIASVTPIQSPSHLKFSLYISYGEDKQHIMSRSTPLRLPSLYFLFKNGYKKLYLPCQCHRTIAAAMGLTLRIRMYTSKKIHPVSVSSPKIHLLMSSSPQPRLPSLFFRGNFLIVNC